MLMEVKAKLSHWTTSGSTEQDLGSSAFLVRPLTHASPPMQTSVTDSSTPIPHLAALLLEAAQAAGQTGDPFLRFIVFSITRQALEPPCLRTSFHYTPRS